MGRPVWVAKGRPDILFPEHRQTLATQIFDITITDIIIFFSGDNI
jgi:hypothetical protein